MSDVVAGGLIGLGGVILGFALNAGWDWWRYREREEKQHESVRTLVRLEMHQNLKTMNEYWRKVTELPPEDVLSRDEHALLQRMRIAELPLLPWDRLMWESLAGFLADAFPPDKLERAYALNKRIPAFLDARSKIQKVISLNRKGVVQDFEEYIEAKSYFATEHGGEIRLGSDKLEQMQAINEESLADWVECKAFHSELQAGNPLD